MIICSIKDSSLLYRPSLGFGAESGTNQIFPSRRAPMPSHRCRHTASSSAPPLRLPKKCKALPLLLVSPLCSETIAVSLIFARRFLFAAAQANLKPALPRAFYLLCYLSQLLAGVLDVRLRFVGARRRAPMPSHRCRHTASSSAPPLRLPKMLGAPPAPRFSALLRNYRGVAHFRSAVSFRGSTGRRNKLKARVAAGFLSLVLFRAITCGDS